MSFLHKLFRGTDRTSPNRTDPLPETIAEQAASTMKIQPDITAESNDKASAKTQPDGAAESNGNPSTDAQPTSNDNPSTDEQPAETGSAWWASPATQDDPSASAPDVGGDETGVTVPSESVAVPEEEPSASTTEAPLDTPPHAVDDNDSAGTRPLTDFLMPDAAEEDLQQGLCVAALRDIGRIRAVNQDSILAMISTLPRDSGDLLMGLFIVADGMGGHASGEVASRLAVSTVTRYILSTLVVPALSGDTTEALQPLVISAIEEANRAIWEHARSIGSDMGTTCTVALMLGNTLYVGHVGDSRIYLHTSAGLECITNDHSAVGRLIQLGQLEPSEARDHPLRSQLYRTVGQHPEVQVDFTYRTLTGVKHLLLCSDGLWSLLDEPVLLDVLDHTIWPQDACRTLIAQANSAGGDDNISAVVVALPISAPQQ